MAVKRSTIAIVLAGLGAVILAYAFFSLYLVSSIPASSFASTEARVSAVIGAVALPAGIGFLVFFLGVFAFFATLRSLIPLALASLAWLYASYNLNQLGSGSVSTDIAPYAFNVVLPLVAFLFLAGVSAILAWLDHFKKLRALEDENAALRLELESKEEKSRQTLPEKQPFLLKE